MKAITAPKKNSFRNNLAYGMYHIIRHLGSYRVEHFCKDNFYASQYFELIRMINEEIKRENQEYKKAMKKSKKGK